MGGSLDMVPLNLGAELSRLLDVPPEDERRLLRDPLLELRRLNGVDGCVGCSRHPSPPRYQVCSLSKINSMLGFRFLCRFFGAFSVSV